MKKLFLLPIFALALCVTSCGDDEFSPKPDAPVTPEDSETINSNKKLVEMRQYSTLEGGPECIYFEYDRSGKLVKAIDTYESSSESTVWIFEWSKEAVEVFKDGKAVAFYYISDGKVVNAEELGYVYSEYEVAYDSNGYLEKYVGIGLDEYGENNNSYVWDDGKLVKSCWSYDSSEYSNIRINSIYRYSTKECKGFYPLNGEVVFPTCPLFYAMPSLIGIAQQALPMEFIEDDEIFGSRYTFYDDGYLKSCVKVGEYGEDVYSFVWE